MSIFTILMSIAGGAFGDEFSDRIQRGKVALQSPEGMAYEKLLGATIGSILRECIPPGLSHWTGKFSLVAYVSASGAVSEVEVQPSTPVSRCFAEGISKATLPIPPPAPYGAKLFPITIEMRIVK